MKKIWFLTISLISALSNIQAAQILNPNWVTVNSGVSEDLHTVEWQDASNVWAVGTAGTVLKSADQGKTWTPVSVGTSENLLSIEWNSSNPSYGLIAGENGTLLFTVNNGDSWDVANFNSGTGAETFTDVAFNGQGTAVAVTLGSIIYRSYDGGAYWDMDGDFSSITPNLHCALFDEGWSMFLAGGDNGKVLIDMDGWFDESLGGSSIRDIDNGNGDILAGGDGGQMFEFNEGFGAFGANVPDDIRGLSGEGGHVYAVAKDGKLYAKESGQPTFELRQTSISSDLTSVDFNNGYGIAVGAGGAIIRTESEGLCLARTIDFSVVDATCYGGSDGSINVSVTPSIDEPEFYWSNASYDHNLTSISAGVYDVSISEAGCLYTGQTIVNEPTELIATIDYGDLTCYQSNDGWAKVEPAGGIPPYTYSWDTSDITDSIGDLSPGTYEVYVYDANGCYDQKSADISEPEELTVNTSGNVSICEGGSAAISASGGVTYQWEPSAGLSDANASNPIANPDKDTDYKVTVTDASGCSAKNALKVIVNHEPEMSVSSSILCEGTSTTLNATAGFVEVDRFDFWEDKTTHNYNAMIPQGVESEGTPCFNGEEDTYGTDRSLSLGSAFEGTAIVTLDIAVPAGTDQIKIMIAASGPNIQAINVELEDGTPQYLPESDACLLQTLTFNDQASFTSDGVASISITMDGSPEGEAISKLVALAIPPTATAFDWKDGLTPVGTGASFNASPSATTSYDVIFTDGMGCESQVSSTVTVLDTPEVVLPNPTVCEPSSETFDAGVWNTYLWSTGESTQSIDVFTDGPVSVTVIDGNGCEGEAAGSLTVNPLPVVTGTNDFTICEGDSAQFNLSGGTTYSWTPTDGLSDPNIANPKASPSITTYYTATVTTAEGCSATYDVDLNVNNLPEPTMPGGEACEGDSVMLVPSAYSGYSWSTGSNDAMIYAKASGLYTVTVTDFNGCQAAASATVSIHSNPVPVLSDEVICDGENYLFDPGAFDSYSWSFGSNVSTALLGSTETFSVTVTDENGCEGVANGSLYVNAAPEVNLDDASICDGDSYLLDAGSGFSAYAWSTGDNTQTISVSNEDTYDITVTNEFGCQASSLMDLTVYDLPQVTLNDQSICQGESAMFDAGADMSAYLWSTSEVTQVITSEESGLFSVTVTNSDGCIAVDTAELTVNPLPTFTFGADPVICQGDSVELVPSFDEMPTLTSYEWGTGETEPGLYAKTQMAYHLTVTNDITGCTASGMSFPIVLNKPEFTLEATNFCTGEEGTVLAWHDLDVTVDFEWSTGQVQDTIKVTAGGLYAVTATVQENGCVNSDTISVNQFVGPTVSLGMDTTLCEGQSVVLDAGSYETYTWSTGGIESKETISASEVVSVTVTDINGCEGSDEIVITVAPGLAVNILADDTTLCEGQATTLNVGEGYTYQWSNGGTFADNEVSSAGNYSVTLTDGSGCTGSDSIIIYTAPELNIDLGMDTVLCEGQTLVFDAGTASTYSWSTGEITQAITVSNAGTYYVDAVDECAGSDTVVVTMGTKPTVDLGPDTLLCSGGSLVLDAGTADSYSWSTGEQTQSITVSSAGTYFVEAMDQCPSYDTIVVAVGTTPSVSLGADTTLCPGEDLELDAGIASTYSWSTGEVTQSITVAGAGIYYVVAGEECEATDTIEVQIATVPTLNLLDVAVCQGESAALIASGFETYLWSDGTVGDTWTGNIEDTTELYVDAFTIEGCKASDSVQITSSHPILELTDTAVCQGEAYTLYAGEHDSYLWHSGETTASISGMGLASLIAVVTVTNTNGCSASGMIELSVSSDMTATIDVTNPTCFNGANGSAATSVSGGIAPYQFFYNNGINGALATGLKAQDYTVIVWDSIGCSVEKSFTVSQPDALTLDNVSFNSTCGNADGAAQLQAEGGTQPYAFNWSIDLTGAQATALTAGIYVAVVTDANGCKDSTAVAIQDNEGPVLTIDSVDHSVCNQPDGAIYTTVEGFEPFTFAWTNGSSIQDQSKLLPGKYGVKVTDANGCVGSKQVTVNTTGNFRPIVKGSLVSSWDETAINKAKVTLIEYTEKTGVLPKFRSVQVDTAGAFGFDNVWVGNYILLVTPDTVHFPNTFKTFFPNVPRWDSAMVFTVNCGDTVELEVAVKKTVVLNGKARIRGTIVKQLKTEFLKTASVTGEPIPGIDVSLEQVPGGVVAQTTTDEDGMYQFDNVPPGDYKIFVDIPGLPMEQTYDVNISESDEDTSVVELDFLVDTTQSIYIEPVTDAIFELAGGVSALKAYPNPFTSEVAIFYELTEASNVQISAVNALGQVMETYNPGAQAPGSYQWSWSPSLNYRGVLMIKATIGQEVFVGKLIRQ